MVIGKIHFHPVTTQHHQSALPRKYVDEKPANAEKIYRKLDDHNERVCAEHQETLKKILENKTPFK